MTALAGLAWLAFAPPTADVAAHTFRAWLWDTRGFTEFNPQWYGGHHVPAYSLLFPPLGAWLGARGAVATAGVFAAAAVVALTRTATSESDTAGVTKSGLAVAWLAVAGVVASLVIGRGPFLLGVAFGALALAWRARPAASGAAALACVCASPVAGLFLLVGALALPLRAAATIGAPVLIGGGTLALLWGEGGEERFVASAFWPLLALVIAALWLVRGPARRAGMVYVAMLVYAFAIPEPVGQNAARLAVLAGPAVLIACAAGPRRAVVVVCAALVYLQWLPAYRAIDEAAGDPSTQAVYYAPLIERLPPDETVEVVFTRNHYEAAYVARHAPLARGWERQLDIVRNRLFYEDGLTPRRYEAWLRAKDVRRVALPSAPLDFSARAEARIVAAAPPFLREVWRSDDWRLFEVRRR